MLEITIAILDNLKHPFSKLFYPFLIITVVALIVGCVCKIERKTEKGALAFNLARWFSILTVLVGVSLAFPSPVQLWEIRLSLIKFHLADPANINKGADVIYRISRSLECRYLHTGCEDETNRTK